MGFGFSNTDASVNIERNAGDVAPFALDAAQDVPTIAPVDHDVINAQQEGVEDAVKAQAAEYTSHGPMESLQMFAAGESPFEVAEVGADALGAFSSPQTPADAMPDRGPVLGA